MRRAALALAVLLAACGDGGGEGQSFELDLHFESTPLECGGPGRLAAVASVRIEVLDDDGAGGLCRRAAVCKNVDLMIGGDVVDFEAELAAQMPFVDFEVGAGTQVRVLGFGMDGCTGNTEMCGTGGIPTDPMSQPLTISLLCEVGNFTGICSDAAAAACTLP